LERAQEETRSLRHAKCLETDREETQGEIHYIQRAKAEAVKYEMTRQRETGMKCNKVVMRSRRHHLQ
jgi:hypothetical protein